MKVRCSDCGEINRSSYEYCQKCSGELYKKKKDKAIFKFNPKYFQGV